MRLGGYFSKVAFFLARLIASKANFGYQKLPIDIFETQWIGIKTKRLLLSAPIIFAFSVASHAQTPFGKNDNQITEKNIDSIIIHGSSLDLVGRAKAASEGVVGYADFEDRPFSRVGELVEVIPNAVATQHSGEGKANQYFLRGFNLDHGTDFSASVDGVPVNLRTHGHGQGYLDLNFVIPEIVERVDFRKGPYRASTGDFSSAGSARYVSYDNLDNNFTKLTIGEFDYLRAVSAANFNLSENTSVLLAVESNFSDGPWALEQDLEKYNGLIKLIHDRGPWHFEVYLSSYDSQWASTDQIPSRAVKSGLVDRFGFIDFDLGGETSRNSFTLQGGYDHNDGSLTEFNAYAVDYDFSLFSNFTYFVNDPINGDEFEQLDKRRYYGAGLNHVRELSDRLSLQAGLGLRFDDISDLGLFKSAGRQRLSTVRQDAVEELSISLWGEAEYKVTDDLRFNLGLRGDYFDADVMSFSEPLNSGEADDSLLSPSAGIAWQLIDGIELYANYGRGFHSNDVRGATITIDPVSGDPVEQVPILVKSEGGEIGARFQEGPFHASVALFRLDLDSELVFVGDAGTTEANDASTRTGIETSVFWKPNDWFVADLSGAYTDSEFDIPGSATQIPGAVKTVFGGGVLAKFSPVTLSARLRHFRNAPLIEDGSIKSNPTTLVNLSSSYEYKNITLSMELLNVFDAKDADISYFFASQLSGEILPVEDIHFHPVEPRQVRFSVGYNF